MLGGAKYCSYIHVIIKVMRNQKDKQEEHYKFLLTEEDRISIEFIMWNRRCDRSMAQEIYELEGKCLDQKNHVGWLFTEAMNAE